MAVGMGVDSIIIWKSVKLGTVQLLNWEPQNLFEIDYIMILNAENTYLDFHNIWVIMDVSIMGWYPNIFSDVTTEVYSNSLLSGEGSAYPWDPNSVITVSADVWSPNGARSSAGTVLTEKLNTLPFKFRWLSISLWHFYTPVTSWPPKSYKIPRYFECEYHRPVCTSLLIHIAVTDKGFMTSKITLSLTHCFAWQ